MLKVYIIVLLTIFFNYKILSCCGPRRINKKDLLNVENGDILKILRDVCQVHNDVKNEKLEEEYKFILDQIIDNGKNKKPEEVDDENKNERFVSFLYKLTIFFKLSDDKKSLVPVKCTDLPYVDNGKFYSDDYILFKLDYKSRNLLVSNQEKFKLDVEKTINENFKDHEFIKIKEIVNIFNQYNPDYFYIIVNEPDHSNEREKPINYGFIFERDKKHQNVFSDKVTFEDRTRGKCCC